MGFHRPHSFCAVFNNGHSDKSHMIDPVVALQSLASNRAVREGHYVEKRRHVLSQLLRRNWHTKNLRNQVSRIARFFCFDRAVIRLLLFARMD